jgi:homoserine dehydrogenase
MIQLATIPKVTKSAQIRDYIAANPKAKSAEVAEAVGVTPAYVATVMWNAKKKAKVVKKAKKTTLTLPKPKWGQLGLFSSDKSLEQLAYEAGVGMAKARMEGQRQIEMLEPKADPVNNPAHYTVGGIETIDFIEAKQFGYNLGNVIKYVTRADHKGNKMEDLCKAQWYLAREINSLK